MDMSIANTYEPASKENNNRPIWEIVIEEYNNLGSDHFLKDEIIKLMKERDNFGRKKHGTPLQAFNGRNPLRDSIQEKCDEIAYIRQAIEEGIDIDDNLKDVYEQDFRDLEILTMVLGEFESRC